MICRYIFIICFLIIWHPSLTAQLDDGKIAPLWSIEDLDNSSWELEDFLDEGKHVIIDFNATWCEPCWEYHETEILEEVFKDFGPSGSNQIHVFMFESDANTNDACCYGPVGCTFGSQGNYTTVSYPVANLVGDELDIPDAYQISYYPTIYIVNADHQTVWQLGQASYNEWEDFINESFSLEVDIELYPGTCDMGEVWAVATGGKGSLTYKWSNGDSGSMVSGPTGYYDVTITDENDYFVAVDNIYLENDLDEFIIDDEDIEDVSCHGESDGSILVDIESSSIVEYQWFDGTTGNYIDQLSADMYELTVTNPDNNCIEVFQFEIEEPDSLFIDALVEPTSCGLENGSISLFANGGNGDYMYDFGSGFSESNSLGALSSGFYTVTVIDENECIVPLELFIDSSMMIEAVVSADSILNCVSELGYLSIDSLSTDHSLVVWTNGNGDTISNELSVELAAATIIYLEIIDTLSQCVYLDSFIISENFEQADFELTGIEELTCTSQTINVGFNLLNDIEVEVAWYDEMNQLISDSTELIVSQAGFYVVELTNLENACSVQYEFEVISSEDFPQASFSYEEDLGLVHVFPDSNGENLNESWTLDGEAFNMPSDYSIFFFVNGSYELCYQIENECGIDTYCDTLIVDELVSNSEIDDEHIQAFVSNNSVYIQSDKPLQGQLRLFNMRSEEVYLQDFSIGMNKERFLIPSLSPGVYILMISSEAKVNAQKVFVH